MKRGMGSDGCYLCGRKMQSTRYLVDTGEDQDVYVGAECYRKVVAAGKAGIKVPDSGVRLYPMTAKRRAYFEGGMIKPVGDGFHDQVDTLKSQALALGKYPVGKDKVEYDRLMKAIEKLENEHFRAKDADDIEYVLWGRPKGKTDALYDKVLYTKGKSPADLERIKKVAAKDGWHSFRVQKIDGTKPDFTKALAKDTLAPVGSPFDVDTDAGAEKMVKREASAGLSPDKIAKKHGFSLSFVKEVLDELKPVGDESEKKEEYLISNKAAQEFLAEKKKEGFSGYTAMAGQRYRVVYWKV